MTNPSDPPVTHPIIEKLRPESHDHRTHVVLVGYIGKVTDDFIQVYPTLDLSVYYRIPEPRKHLISQEPALPGVESSPTRLVVDGSTKVHLVQSRSIEASYLSGLIASGHLPGTTGGPSVMSKTPPKSQQLSPTTVCTQDWDPIFEY